MNNHTNNIYKNARIKAGLKREPVAEELHIDVRTLDKYESFNGKAPDDIVKQMCLLYGNRFLAFQHLKQGPLGEFLPDLENSDFKGATLEMVLKSQDIDGVVLDIVKIASDGKIDETEKQSWEQAKSKIMQVISTFVTVLLSDKQEGKNENGK